MHRIQDKKRWWAANFCTQTAPIQQNRSFDVLAPLGLMFVMVGILAVAALIYYHPHAMTGVSLANAPIFVAIKEAVDSQAEVLELFKKTSDEKLASLKNENVGLLGRIEELESREKVPGKPANSGGQGNKPEFKAFPTSQGTVYQMPHTTRMADVIPVDEKDRSPISFERWLGAAVLGEKSADREAFRIASERKELNTSTTGLQIPIGYISQWIDRLRAAMVLNAAGMTTATMDTKSQVRTVLASDATASWHTESAAITAANPTFVLKTLTASTLVSRCTCSVEVAADSPNFGEQLASVMSRAMAQELDRAGLIGTGIAPEPTGVINNSGINAVPGGSITDYSKFITAVTRLLNSNVPLDVATRNIIMNPNIWADLENLTTGLSGDKTQLPRPRALQNTNFLVTTAMPEASPVSDTALLGDFSDLVMGIRKEASIEVLKIDSYVGNLILEFIGYCRADFVVTRPASFCKVYGLG